MSGILEICCTSFESALIASQAGANRIELCDSIFEGGTTPSAGMIRKINNEVDIDLYVLIRPRGGDFTYSSDEFKIMQAEIEYCDEVGVQGIVSGVLLEDGKIDKYRTKELVDLSGNMDFTFHRAFDLVKDPRQAIQDVIEVGASRILTSGLKNNVVEGTGMLKDLVHWAGRDTKIMAGGGLNSANLEKILATTGCREFHTTAKNWVESSADYQSDVLLNSSKDIPESKRMVASIDKIRTLRNILDKIY